MVGILQFASRPSTFNGGLSQIQPWFLQGSGTFAFLNLLKESQSWTYISTNATVKPSELDSNGYPTSLPSGGIYTTFFVPTQTERPGNYVATWDGNGTIYVNNNNTLVSGSKTSTTGSGRYVFSTTASSFIFGINAITGPAITNLKVYHIDDEPDVLTGKVFGSQFKSMLAQSKCGVFRFLDWQNGNTTNQTTWNTRKPVDYVFYNGSEYRASLYAGVTTNSGNDYSINFGSGAPADKQTIHLNFNTSGTYTSAGATFSGGTTANSTSHGLTAGEPIGYISSGTLPSGLWQGITYYVLASGLTANSFQFSTNPGGSPVNYGSGGSGSHFWVRCATLNLNGTGAVPIKTQTGDTTQTNDYPKAVNGGGATIYGTLVYDAALNSWLKFGADSNGSGGLNNCVPPEICLRLCTELGMHPYFVTPYLAADPVTDYMSNLAAMVKNSGPSWMIPRFEGTNETWNSASGFYATRYGWNKAFLSWGTQFDQDNWVGRAFSLVAQSINSIYGGTPSTQTKYQFLVGVQTVGGTNPTANNARLASTKYVADGGSAAYNWATHVCCAQYINPSEQREAQELIDAYNYSVTYSGNSAQQTIIANSYVDTLNSGSGTFNLANTKILYQGWFGWAQGNWGGSINLKLTGYEGGYSPDYTTGNSTSPITGATVTSGTTVDLTISQYKDFQKSSFVTGNPAVVGMQMIVSSVGGMTQLNGNTYTVAGVSGNTVTITVPDTTGFGAYTSGGTATWVNSQTYINNLRKAGKSAPNLQGYTYGNSTGNKSNYQNFIDAGGEFPSCYMLAGPNQVWSVFDPSIYATPGTQWDAIKSFNA